jgi:hypothetical protein
VWPLSFYDNPEISTPVFERPMCVSTQVLVASLKEWLHKTLVFNILSEAEFFWLVQFAFIMLSTAWGKVHSDTMVIIQVIHV